MMRGWWLPLCAAFLVAGCASTTNLRGIEAPLKAGSYAAALEEGERKADDVERAQGPLVRALDVGMLAHYGREWRLSNDQLDEAEALIGEAYTKSVGRSAASFVVNDNTKTYPGEDFEDIYANVFKSLNWYHEGRVEDAMVEIRRGEEKQQVLRDLYADSNAKGDTAIRFTHSALGDWLGCLYSTELGAQADREFFLRRTEEVFRDQQGLYPFAVPAAVEREAVAPAVGMVRIHFLAFTGIEPRKLEDSESIWLPSGNWMTVSVPVLAARVSEIGSIEGWVDGTCCTLMPLEDLSSVAINTYQLKKAGIYSKAILRATGKAVTTDLIDFASHAAAYRNDDAGQGLLADLATIAANLFANLSERADVRMSHFFPALASVGSLDVPEGTHAVRLVFKDKAGSVLATVSGTMEDGGVFEGVCLR